jgi:uncharacterized membrane protein YbhN (UPF0104 family)
MKIEWTPGRRRVALILMWLASTALLIACFRAINWSRAMEVMATANPFWIAAAVVANAAIIPGMAAFWWALRPRNEPPATFSRMFEVAATASSLMNTVPFGAGHASAVVLLVKRASTSQRGALSVLALDQLGEGVAKVSVFLLVALLVPMPGWMRAGITTTTALVAALLVGLVVASRWARELRILLDWRRAGAALACVASTKVVEAMAIIAVQHAFGVSVSFAGTLLVLAAVILGTILPVAPGNLGTYEASVFLTYRWLGVSAEQAFSLALVQHVCFMLPSVGIGYFFLSAHTLSRRAIASR